MIGNGEISFALASSSKTFDEMKKDISNLLPEGIKFSRLKDDKLHPGVSASITLDGKQIG